MKLSRAVFQRFWEVHAWTGLLGALLLSAMFYAAAFALFHEELESWLEPPLASSAQTSASLEALAGPWIARPDVDPARADVYLPHEGDARLRIGTTKRGEEHWETLVLAPSTGAASAPRSRLASVIFDLHYLWHDRAPWLMYVAGLLSVLLLLAIVTGVLIHWRDLATQLVQFRPTLRPRFGWSDAHKILGVLGLPFQAIYAYTGALITLGAWLIAPFVGPVFRDTSAADAALYGDAAEVAATTRTTDAPRARLPLDELLARGRAVHPELTPTRIVLEQPAGKVPTARIDLRIARTHGFPNEDSLSVVLHAETGAVLADDDEASHPPARRALDAVYAVHFAHFGGLALRILFALLSMATCLTLLSGNWIWLLRREARAASFGHRALARLTLGVGVGLPIAFALAFLVNRLMPARVLSGAAIEEAALFGTWAVVQAGCLFLRDLRAAWTHGLWIAGTLHLVLPAASAVTGHAGLLHPTGAATRACVGVELGMVLLGAAFVLAARRFSRGAAARAPRTRRLHPMDAVDG